MTLLETLLALALVGVLGAMATVRWTNRSPLVQPSEVQAAVSSARTRAIAHGRSVTITLLHGGNEWRVTVHADGAVLAPPELAFDRLSGRLRVAHSR